MLSDKVGIINTHTGDGEANPDHLNRAVEETELPIHQLLSTYTGHNPDLFGEGIEYMKKGGHRDFTGAGNLDLWGREYGEVWISKTLKRITDEEISYDLLTFTPDGQGSPPMLDENNNCIGLGMGKSSCLLETIQECVFKEDVPLEIALRGLTVNLAKISKLKGRGQILPGHGVGFNPLDERTLETHSVFVKGKTMAQDRKLKILGALDPGWEGFPEAQKIPRKSTRGSLARGRGIFSK